MKIFKMKLLQIIFILSSFVVNSLQHQGIGNCASGDHGEKTGRPQRKPKPPGKTHKDGWGWDDVVNDEIPTYIRPPLCLDPSQINQVPYDPDFYALFRLWYYKGITKYASALFARILLGRYPTSQKELNEMCLSQVFGDYSALLINNGFGVQSGFECSGNVGYSECSVLNDPNTYDGALGVDPNAGYINQVSWMVNTDNETFVIFYVCNDGTYGDIQMFTTTPYVSPSQAKIFLDVAFSYGIPVNQLQLSICKSPYTYGQYPPPFQNYPNSPGNENNGWGSGNHGWNQQPQGWNQPSQSGWNQPPQSGWNRPSQSGWSQPSQGGWKPEGNHPSCRFDKFSKCWGKSS